MTDDQPVPPPPVHRPIVRAVHGSRPETAHVQHLRGLAKPTWGVLGWSIAVVLGGMIVAAGLSLVLWPMFRGVLPWHDTGRRKVDGLDLVKLALSVVAGAGGAGALTVSVRKQRILERDAEGQRAVDAAFRSRYGEAATQLGSDRAAVQLAGVYAMANLADDWDEQRQQCVDVLCGFLRLPPPTDEALQASDAKVRTTISDVLREHLQEGGPWCDLDFNLTGAYLVDLNLDGAQFTGQTTSFDGAQFSGQITWFAGAQFTGQTTYFNRAQFTSDTVSFDRAQFSGEDTSFADTKFTSKTTSFADTKFTSKAGDVFAGSGIPPSALRMTRFEG